MYSIPVVVPACPAWCTTGPHRADSFGMEPGTLSVLHEGAVGRVEVAQIVEFTADGVVAVDTPFLNASREAMTVAEAVAFAHDVNTAAVAAR